MALDGRLTAIVPAAGFSRRAGRTNKLVLPFGDGTVISTVVSKAAAIADRTLVVVGHEAERITAAVRGLAVDVVHNDRFADGMSASIVAAVRHDPDASGYLIWPGDMPAVDPETVRLLRLRSEPGRITVPTHDGRRGHPVLFAAAFRDELARIQGDTGARSVLGKNPGSVDEIPVSDPGILFDIDHPAAGEGSQQPHRSQR